MKHPNLNEEKSLWKQGYSFVIGLDEAGRGPLAGPVVAGAVTIKISNFPAYRLPAGQAGTGRQFPIANKFLIRRFLKEFSDVNDSKKLSVKKREALFKILTKHPQISCGIGVVSEKVIDKINILKATKLAMTKAIKALTKKINKKANFIILDGNFKLNTDIPQKSIIKGDQKSLSIAMASIIAKVYRDNLMLKLHKKFSQYGFEKHKGYGTAYHYEMIKKYGPSVIHRKTFDLFH